RADRLELGGVRVEPGQQGVPVRVDLADEAEPVRLVGVDGVAGHHHLQQPLAGQRAGQVRDDDHREEADLDLGHGEAGPGGGEDDVAHAGQAHAARVGGALHGGDDGLGRLQHELVQVDDGAGPEVGVLDVAVGEAAHL